MTELTGAMTAIVTPFAEDGSVDHAVLDRLCRWQVDRGIAGLVPCGTTGEGATLTEDEQFAVVQTAVRAAEGRVPVIAGCGSNDTRRTVRAAVRAVEAGADALLVVSPYYNKPNLSGLLRHYEAVASATPKPIVLYNVPGRTGHNLGAATILRIAEIPGVDAVKEAAADLDQMSEILADRPDGFAVLSGDDSLTLPAIALGADGVISVVANEAPAEMRELVRCAACGDLDGARAMHYRLLPLMRANFLETNPVPVKTAMALLGHGLDRLRSPLGPPDDETRRQIREALSRVGLLEARP